ncbi:MAG TPA: sialidase family protein [Candidatus Binataceae bacterium]|nr:sialidase family protein [Candidatus Binataceae bacterium]
MRKLKLVSLAVSVCLANLIGAATVRAQWADQRLAMFDKLMEREHQLAKLPHAAAAERGAWGNVAALAARWPLARPDFARMALQGEPIEDWEFDPAAVRAAAAGGPISTENLANTRLSGFTQNETASAWCGGHVVVTFNDTGAEVNTFEGSDGVSAIGASTSANKGSSYAYDGPPSPPTNVDQMIVGDPSVVCTNQSDFYYSATWWDGENVLTGVAMAASTNGGSSYGQPVVAISKDGFTHEIIKDALAIDPANTGQVYITYVDEDYSGTTCGDFPESDPNAGEPIPRYAIELVYSTDGGTDWSAPAVIEEVCANDANPNAFVEGPSVAVGAASVVYVAYETMGENGGQLTDRNIKIAVSSNEGASFATPTIVSSVNPVGDGADLQGLIQAAEYPSIAIGRGTHNFGYIYLAWDTATTEVNDILSTTGVYGFADILFSQSQNGATTWSSPKRVNTNPEGGPNPYSDQFEPAIDTDKTGRIGICYYDRHRDPNNFLIDRTCSSSTNNGASWTSKLYTKTNFPSVVGQDVLVAPDYFGDYDTVAVDKTNAASGFVDSFATSVGGHPNVSTNHF